MYALRLAFRNASDDRLIVHAALDHAALDTAALNSSADTAPLPSGRTAQTIYEDEDSFLRRLIAADLESETTQELVIAVIRAIAEPTRSEGWVEAKLSADQSRILGLNLTPSTSFLPNRAHPFGFADLAEQFSDFLMQSPTPFAMVSGPAHTITFINAPYIRILGRTSPEQLLGLPLLEAIPELEGQLCLSLLEEAYCTGCPQKRTELKSTLQEEDTGLSVEVYFDIVYQPLRNAEGRVHAIMAQATDVTERVLSRQVTEHREQKLYRLWAELDTVYRALPVGIAVIEAKSFLLLRLNKLLAELLGSSADELMGTQLPSAYPQMASMLAEAAKGVTARGVLSVSSDCCQFTFIPTLDTQGMVETITLIAAPLPRTPPFLNDLSDDHEHVFSLA